MAEDDPSGRKLTRRSVTMYSLAGTQRYVEPKFNEPDPAAAGEYDTAQSAYLAASGTLTQFNAILAAIQAAAFSATTGGLRVAVAGALALHVLGAFLLCWAARPVEPSRAGDAMMALMQARVHVDDTFKNYRRGWRMTMLALCVSAVALLLYVLGELGFPIPLNSN